MPPSLLPKPSPIPRSPKLFIYSLFTLQKALKNYPKHFRSLKIETRASRFIHFQMLAERLLTRLQKRSKSLPVLDFEKHEQFFKLRVPQALATIKSFNHLNSLSLFGNIRKYFSNNLYTKWFRQSTELTYVIFGTNSTYNFPEVFDFPYFRLIQAKYQRILKHSRFLSLVLQSHEALVSESKSYPPRLYKLSISLDDPLVRLSFLDFSHLHHLSILHLNVPLLIQSLLKILNSLPNPQKITHLTAFASDGFDSNNNSAQKFSETLASLQSLCSLHLKIHSCLYISTFHKFLENSSSLRELTLHLPILNQVQLISLAFFVGNFKQLSLLAIVNSKTISGPASQGYQILFPQISRFTQLKSLEIDLGGVIDSPQKLQFFSGCLGEFAGCLEVLPELQEIKFTQSESCAASEFDSLADILKRKGSRLKKLKIKFVNGEKIDHLKELNKAFLAMANLEELSLSNIWTTKESFIQFAEVVSELKWISSVRLDGENPHLEKIDLGRALSKILIKYGLEELKWFSESPIDERNYIGNFGGVVNFIDIKEVMLRNPRLHSVYLDSHGLYFKNVKGFLPENEFTLI